jgi:hypothetical protein
LFKKLWPKLLQASSVEAIAECQKTKEYIVPTVQSVHAFLQNDEKAKISEKQINDSVEAIAECQKTKEYIVPTVQSVHAFLQNDEKAKISEKQINEQLKVIIRQSKDKIVFETCKAGQQQALHKSYVRAEPNLLKQKTQPIRNSQTRLNITYSNREQQQGQRR